MAELNVNLSGLELENPVIPASGTFGYGYEFAQYYDINCLGSFSFKGTTRQPRFGNPTPRIAECPAGIINAVGLQNPGVEAVIEEELPKLRPYFHKKVIANVSGFSVEDYAYTCEKLDQEEQVGLLEVNVSCPNVHGGGMSFGTSPEAAAEVTRAVKQVTKKPVYIKLSPNVADIPPSRRPARTPERTVSASSTPSWACASICAPKGRLSPTPWGACPAPPSSRWPCEWSTRSMRRSRSPSSAWGACRRRKMSSR